MDAFLVPIPHSRFKLCFALALLALHFLQEQAELLPECVKRFPPMAAAVLVAVSHVELVEQVLDVEQHCFVVGSCVQESFSGDGWRGHFGPVRELADGHCALSIGCS